MKSSMRELEGLQLNGIYFFKAPVTKIQSKLCNRKECQFIVISGGSYKAFIPGIQKPVLAGPGDVLFWRTGETRIEENDPSNLTKCFSIYFLWPDPPASLPNCCKDYNLLISRLADILLDIKDIVFKPELIRPLSNAYITAMAAEYMRLAQLAEDRIVNNVAKYIEEHMSENIRLKDLAKHIGLEIHHFGRKYKALTGRTPMYDVKHRKVEHAKGMLFLEPRRSLSNIAERVGIRDAFRLSRLINRYTGLSAREIRKQYKTTQKAVKARNKRKRNRRRAVLNA